MRRLVRIPLLAAVLASLACAAGARAAVASPFSPCAGAAGFDCATVTVPLDRGGSVPGTIALSVERRTPASGPSREAVLALAGGPGQATLPLAGFIAEAIAPALSGRDLLLFDQRGTGASQPLSCGALGAEVGTASSVGELVERCARQLGPARGDYTTRESVQDIEAIRRAAGYEKLVLYGTSYGTKVALQYAARYPQNVASMVLDSTETPEGPEPFHVSTFKAIGPALAELCSHGACAGITANPLHDLARLVARTLVRPMSGRAYDERGRHVRRPITARELFYMLLSGDLNPALRAEMPAAVHAALRGDAGPLARIVELASLRPAREEASSEIDETLFIDTSCEETAFPWRRTAPEATRAVEAEAALNALPNSDFYPFDAEAALLDQTIPLCVSWPDASAPPPAPGPLPNVPALILSGGQDLRTPLENARRVAALIPDAQILHVPYTGHSVLGSDLSGCARTALSAFFASGRVAQCGAGVDHFPPAPLAPRRLSSLAPTRGLRAARGRTLTAAIDTLLDLRRTVVELALGFGEVPRGLSFGGLRGGFASLGAGGVRLSRLSYVPGVRLSGTIPLDLLLRNRGAGATLGLEGAAGGRLRVAAGGRLSGRLGGRGFRVDVAARVRVARGEGAAQQDWLAGPSSLPVPRLGALR